MTEEIKEEIKTEVKEEVKEENKVEDKKTLELNKDLDFEIIDGVKYSKDLIKEARQDGWRYKDSFKGDNNKYLAPDKFVERGQKLPAFLNKKLADKDEDIKNLKKLLEKNFKTQVIDKIETLDEKLQEAEDMGESKKISSMTRKKIELERELAELSKEEKKPKQPQVPKKPLEVIAWEMRNPWLKTNEQKKIKANEIFYKINNNPNCFNLSADERLKLLDINLKDYDSTNKQKKNLTAPISQTKTALPTGKITRSIKHLKPALKKQFEEFMVGNDGKKFTGRALELATESFLEACGDSHFNK